MVECFSFVEESILENLMISRSMVHYFCPFHLVILHLSLTLFSFFLSFSFFPQITAKLPSKLDIAFISGTGLRSSRVEERINQLRGFSACLSLLFFTDKIMHYLWYVRNFLYEWEACFIFIWFVFQLTFVQNNFGMF